MFGADVQAAQAVAARIRRIAHEFREVERGFGELNVKFPKGAKEVFDAMWNGEGDAETVEREGAARRFEGLQHTHVRETARRFPARPKTPRGKFCGK